MDVTLNERERLDAEFENHPKAQNIGEGSLNQNIYTMGRSAPMKDFKELNLAPKDESVKPLKVFEKKSNVND